MIQLLRRRPSPALVVAGIALFVVLSGSAYAVSTQIPRQSVGTIQLRDNAVTSPKIRDSTITTSDVRNRSLLAEDFARGQLPAGPAGAAGPAGPAGPAGAAGPAGPAGASGLVLVSASSSVDSLDTHDVTVTCPSPKKVLGGGYSVINEINDVTVLVSRPAGDNNQWLVRGVEADSSSFSWGVTAFALCATIS
jgi:hypothetical protein